MEVVVERENLKKALARVKRNKGAAGIDGMNVEELPAYLKEHWPTIRAQLLEGTYKAQPVRRVEIPKALGGMRPLGIPTVLDRFIQQAVMQVLQADWDGTFSETSFGFRPGRSAHQAVERAQAYIAAGHGFVVDIDLEKYFDRVNHDILMGLVAKRVADKRLLKLIRGFLTAGVMEGGLVSPTEEGTPQGGPLSPLLSNLMLDVLDKELEKRGHRFVRYADDCNIYVRSQMAGERVMAGIEKFLAKRLRLKVNKAKSAVAKPSVRKFLSFSFTGGRKPRRRIAPQAIARFKARVRELTRRTGGRSVARSSRSCPPTLSAGAVTSASVKPRRCCGRSMSGSGGGGAPSPGSSGSVDRLASPSCDAAASAGTWRRKPPAVRMALGGLRTAPRSPSHYQPAFSVHSAWLLSRLPSPHNPSNRRIRTRTSGGVGGEKSRGFPLSRLDSYLGTLPRHQRSPVPIGMTAVTLRPVQGRTRPHCNPRFLCADPDGGDDGGMPPNLDARVKALESRTSEMSVDVKALIREVSGIKGKISQMPTTFQMQVWFVGVALGLVVLVFTIARDVK